VFFTQKKEKNMKRNLLSFVMVSLAASTLSTGHAADFKGGYAGLVGGYKWTQPKKENGAPKPKTIKGFAGGIQLGFGSQPMDNAFYVGGHLDILFGGGSSKEEGTARGVVTNFKIRDAYQIVPVAQFGWIVNDFMPYVEVGPHFSSVKGSVTALGTTIKGTSNKWGVAAGFGVKYKPHKNLQISLGYRHSRIGGKTKVEITGTSLKLNLPRNSNQVLLGAAWSF
jgi:opacity protein-like surface antigen